jgi:hypothetical protein
MICSTHGSSTVALCDVICRQAVQLFAELLQFSCLQSYNLDQNCGRTNIHQETIVLWSWIYTSISSVQPHGLNGKKTIQRSAFAAGGICKSEIQISTGIQIASLLCTKRGCGTVADCGATAGYGFGLCIPLVGLVDGVGRQGTYHTCHTKQGRSPQVLLLSSRGLHSTHRLRSSNILLRIRQSGASRKSSLMHLTKIGKQAGDGGQMNHSHFR